MAPKRSVPLNNPPSPSVSDEPESEEIAEDEEEDREPEDGDEESEEEEEEEDDDEEQEEVKKSDPVTPSVEKNASSKRPALSDSGSDSESDSETDSGEARPSPTVSDYAVKPIASKVMVDAKSSKSPSKLAGLKRSAELEQKDSAPEAKKKNKIANGVGIDEEEKKSSMRVWSEEDEIAVLNGMIEFRSKKGINPYHDMAAFHEFIKKSIQCSVSKSQLMDKIRRLKKKYQANADREKPVFSRAHEGTIFGLGKKIWSDDIKVKVKKPSKKSPHSPLPLPEKEVPLVIKPEANGKKVIQGANMEKQQLIQRADTDNGDLGLFWSHYPLLKESVSFPLESLRDSWGIEAIRLIGRTKADEMEEEWRHFKLEEWKLHLRKMDLIRKHTGQMLDALNSTKG